MLRVTALTPDLVDAWTLLFEACASSCFCRYWHFEGTKNEWLERLAFTPGTNTDEQRAAVREAHPSGRGLVALDGDVVVGWMKLSPRSAVPKLRRLPVYRALDLGDDDGVLSIGCVLVHPAHRRRGVARALLEEALASAKATGARAVEAYPHRRSEALRDEELWMGPLSLFEAYGFLPLEGNAAYPVLRCVLEGRVSGK
jgi:ribosomal protein S18 acetylase RimI-like enzyme